MIDTSWVMRESSYFNKEMLENYILNTAGGSALSFLTFLTGLEPEHLITDQLHIVKEVGLTKFQKRAKEIHDDFHSRCGSREPGLVVGFNVDKLFQSGNLTSDGTKTNSFTDPGLVYDKENAVMLGGKIVTHSMILIGSQYCSKQGEYMFSLQNWWPEQFLVTVSAEYLASCEAKVVFLRKDVALELREDLDTIDDVYAEGSTPGEDTCFDDGLGDM